MGSAFRCIQCSNDEINEDDYLVVPGADTYQGERNFLNQRNGRGIYYYGNGDIYDGQWKNDEKHGYGTYTTHNGKVYDGFFHHDKYTGVIEPSTKPNSKRTNQPKPLIIDNEVLSHSAATSHNSYQNPQYEQQQEQTRQQIIQAQVAQRVNENKRIRDQERRAKHEKKVEELRQKYGINSKKR